MFSASKAVIDSGSGQLYMMGYIPTGANDYSSFHCPTTDPLSKFLYVGASVYNGALSGEIQIYNLDPVSGTLARLQISPLAEQDAVSCLDFEPTGKFAYASSGTNGSTGLLTFSADAQSGVLTWLNATSLPGIPTRTAMDPIGNYLYLAAFSSDYSAASALGYSIDPSSGVLTPIPGTPFPLSNATGTFSFHPSGNF